MAEYLVKSTNTRTFSLLADTQVLGELKYTQWYSLKATIALPEGATFRVEPKGFWGTTIEMKDQEAVLVSFKMNWEGNIILKSRLGGTSQALVLKNTGLMKGGYQLLNKQGEELLSIEPSVNWSKNSYDYTVVSSALFEALADKTTLLLLITHCANYYMTMASSMVPIMLSSM